MTKPGFISDGGVARAVEHQMRNWEFQKAQTAGGGPTFQESVCHFIAISRMPGAGGRVLADLLAERLGWPVFDKDILHLMAGDDRIRQKLYESMDEKDLGWLDQMLNLLISTEFRRNDYFRQLTRTVLAVTRQGRAIFLGRGAGLILPRDRGLSVRVVASMDGCVQRYAERTKLPPDQCRRDLVRLGEERERFIAQYFNRRSGDPLCYDLVLNFDYLSSTDGAEVVLAAMRSKGMTQVR